MKGFALILAVMAVFCVSAVAAALTMLAATEIRISGSYVGGISARYAAEAGAEIGIEQLSLMPDWQEMLAGAVAPGFTDGPPGGTRRLADGSVIDLDQLSQEARLENRPSHLFAFGPVLPLAASPGRLPDAYVAVWIGAVPSDPAAVQIYADAFGLLAARRAIAARVRREPGGQVHLVFWKESP